MLQRIFADNYKALVNFELRPGRLSLLLGDNGSGKTSVFDVLGKLRELIVLGLPVNDLFRGTRTRWDGREVQRFELDVEGQGGTYRYVLELQHGEGAYGEAALRSESVTFDGAPLYRFSAGEIQLFADDDRSGAVFPFRPDRSFLYNLDSSGARKMTRLLWFRDFLIGLWIVQPNPFAMAPESRQDAAFLERDGRNFASFFSFLNSEIPAARTELERRLADAMPGFQNFSFRRIGDAKLLLANFQDDEQLSATYHLRELSEGQRVLAVLYAAVCGLLRPGTVLCFDEPDNFVSLPEIQPWLQALRDTLEQQDRQAMLISHHPEVLDYLALDSLWRFERPSGPVLLRQVEVDASSPLKLSELVARSL